MMQAAQPVDLTAELAEVLRWREMEWSRIPPLSRKLVMPYLGAGDTINLDTAVTNNQQGGPQALGEGVCGPALCGSGWVCALQS